MSVKMKDALAVLVVLTLLWLLTFGNLLAAQPNLQTWVVFVVCAVSFAVLSFLRVLSFLAFLRESSRICGGRMRRLLGIISLLIFVLGPIIYFVLFDESNQADISWIQLTIFYALIVAGVIYVFFRPKGD